MQSFEKIIDLINKQQYREAAEAYKEMMGCSQQKAEEAINAWRKK